MRPDLEFASKTEWELATARAEVLAPMAETPHCSVEAVDRAAAELHLSRAMVYRLLARYRRDPHPSSLLLVRKGPPVGTRLLDPKVEKVVEVAINQFYLTSERPRVADVYRITMLECRKSRLHPPSYKAVWKRIHEMDPRNRTLKREGMKAANDKFRPVSKAPSAKLPLDIVQIDHSLADVIVVDEIERRSIGRPWLTLAIDVASRCVAGFYLSLEYPSSTSVALAIAQAVLPKTNYLNLLEVDRSWPIHGIPRTFYLDNAKEFHGQALERGCREHGIELRYRPVRTPHYGGHIERLIGTFMGEIHLLPGTTFSSVADRGDYDSAGKAVMTLKELECWLFARPGEPPDFVSRFRFRDNRDARCRTHLRDPRNSEHADRC